MPKTYSHKNQQSSLPAPKYRSVVDTDNTKRAALFFKFWQSLKPEQLELVQAVKVYRLWPIVDLKLVEHNRRDVTWKILEGACPFEPDQYIDWFLRHPDCGSGEWWCIMNEVGVEGPIMECKFSAIDMEHFPPVVNLRTVIWGAERNKNYKRFLQARNIHIPGDNQEEDQEVREMEDMNAASAIASEAISKVAEMAQAKADSEVASAHALAEAKVAAAVAAQPQADTIVARDIGEMYRKGAEGVVSMVTNHAGQQYSPVDMMRELKDLWPSQPSNEPVMRMLLDVQEKGSDRVIGLLTSQMDSLRNDLNTMRAGPVANSTPSDPVDSLLATVERFEKIKTLVGGGRNNGNTPAPVVESRPGFWEFAFTAVKDNPQILSSVIGGVGALVTGAIDLFRGPRPQGYQHTTATPGQHYAPPAPAPAPAPAEEPWEVGFVKWITPAFLAHFSSSLEDHEHFNGFSLAEWVIGNGLGAAQTQQGRMEYNKAKELLGPKLNGEGKPMGCRLHDLFMRWPPVYNVVKELPQQYDRFMGEFFSYDSAEEESIPGPVPVEKPLKPQVV